MHISPFSTNIAETQKQLFGIPNERVKKDYKLIDLRVEIQNQERPKNLKQRMYAK